MNPLLGIIVEHFLELLASIGFLVFSFIYKFYKIKRCKMVYGVILISLVAIIYDGMLRNSILFNSYIPLFYIETFNVYLCSLVIAPIDKKTHIFLAIPITLGIIFYFIFPSYFMLSLIIICVIYFVYIIIYSIYRLVIRKTIFDELLIIFFALINLSCIYLQVIYPESVLFNKMVLISTLTIFIVFVVKEGNKKKVEQEKKIQTQRTSIAISQIQPHFLYNSLATIGYICKKDANKASEAIDKFSDYLRANLNSLRTESNIPFKEELRHVQTYLWLEKLRFEDRLNIVYDIGIDNFLVPPLSIQPLVENAVKHGICEKLEGGTLYIRTIDYNEKIKIIIEDNGVGFDQTKKKNDGKSHVGIENVKSRIKSMADGELVITSEIGKGTISTITLPKENI